MFSDNFYACTFTMLSVHLFFRFPSVSLVAWSVVRTSKSFPPRLVRSTFFHRVPAAPDVVPIPNVHIHTGVSAISLMVSVVRVMAMMANVR